MDEGFKQVPCRITTGPAAVPNKPVPRTELVANEMIAGDSTTESLSLLLERAGYSLPSTTSVQRGQGPGDWQALMPNKPFSSYPKKNLF